MKWGSSVSYETWILCFMWKLVFGDDLSFTSTSALIFWFRLWFECSTDKHCKHFSLPAQSCENNTHLCDYIVFTIWYLIFPSSLFFRHSSSFLFSSWCFFFFTAEWVCSGQILWRTKSSLICAFTGCGSWPWEEQDQLFDKRWVRPQSSGLHLPTPGRLQPLLHQNSEPGNNPYICIHRGTDTTSGNYVCNSI